MTDGATAALPDHDPHRAAAVADEQRFLDRAHDRRHALLRELDGQLDAKLDTERGTEVVPPVGHRGRLPGDPDHLLSGIQARSSTASGARAASWRSM